MASGKVLIAPAGRITLALHEAAHAVAGHLLGFPVPHDLAVSIDEPDGGRAQTRPAPGRRPIMGFWLVHALAGDAALRFLAPNLASPAVTSTTLRLMAEHARPSLSGTIWPPPHPAFDVEEDAFAAVVVILSAAPAAHLVDLVATFREAEEIADFLVREPMIGSAIERVMVALVHRGRITGSDVERLITSRPAPA